MVCSVRVFRQQDRPCVKHMFRPRSTVFNGIMKLSQQVIPQVRKVFQVTSVPSIQGRTRVLAIAETVLDIFCSKSLRSYSLAE